MSDDMDSLRRGLAAAHADALRVHDSPGRADRLFADIERIAASVPAAHSLGEEKSVRLAAALKDALRVLRRDEDGREAAKHLQTGFRLLEGGPRAPSPFLDD
jgi:hypothetical protein